MKRRDLTILLERRKSHEKYFESKSVFFVVDLKLNELGAVLKVVAPSIYKNFQKMFDGILFLKVARFRVFQDSELFKE